MMWLWIIGFVLLLCVAEWIREIVTFRVTHYEICSKKLTGLSKEKKIIFLSDLHDCTYGKENERLLAAIRAQNPDAVLVGGDMLIGAHHVRMEHGLALIKALSKEFPVYCANGNHEQRMKLYPETFGNSYEEYKEAVLKSGATLLENEMAEIVLDKARIHIFGLEVPAMCYAKFQRTSLTVSEIEERIGKPGNAYNLLLAHNPKYMPVYAKWGADIVLAGHYHGGVVRIPGIGGVISPQGRLFPPYSGEHKKIGMCDAIVSKGLGLHTMRIRFLNPAEMIVLHFSSQN